MAVYELALVLIALAIFSAIILPRWFADKPLSFPIIYVALGFVLFWIPLGFQFLIRLSIHSSPSGSPNWSLSSR